VEVGGGSPTITGNIISRESNEGSLLDIYNGKSVTIFDNQIIGQGYIDNDNTGSLIYVPPEEVRFTANGISIWDKGNVRDLHILGNTITNCNNAVTGNDGTHNIDNILVENNLIYNNLNLVLALGEM
jgi:hypothetical protein